MPVTTLKPVQIRWGDATTEILYLHTAFLIIPQVGSEVLDDTREGKEKHPTGKTLHLGGHWVLFKHTYRRFIYLPTAVGGTVPFTANDLGPAAPQWRARSDLAGYRYVVGSRRKGWRRENKKENEA